MYCIHINLLHIITRKVRRKHRPCEQSLRFHMSWLSYAIDHCVIALHLYILSKSINNNKNTVIYNYCSEFGFLLKLTSSILNETVPFAQRSHFILKNVEYVDQPTDDLWVLMGIIHQYCMGQCKYYN